MKRAIVLLVFLLLSPLGARAWQADSFVKPSKADLQKRLSKIQFEVTQEDGTERAFKNEYWDNKTPGLYVDVVSGEPLFSSLDKYDSGTGWPSFTRPLNPANIVEKEDRKLFVSRTEVRSKYADSHLGHVFDDGPPPTGKRYCMNSAALRFVPAERLAQEGYGAYVALFDKNPKKPETAGTAATPNASSASTVLATFAGGCFWCMEPPFEKLDGVKEVLSGYTGGTVPNPTYDAVSSGSTGHIETVQITFDPRKVSYQTLLDVFWRQIDPTDAGGQFVDRGAQYGSAIFYHDDEQKRLAEESLKKLESSKRFAKPVVTPIRKASVFYPAEDYHQDYYKKNPVRYKFYRYNSGRDQFLDKHWKKDEREVKLPKAN